MKLNRILIEEPTANTVFQKVPFGGNASVSDLTPVLVTYICEKKRQLAKYKEIITRIIKTYNKMYPGTPFKKLIRFVYILMKDPAKYRKELSYISPALLEFAEFMKSKKIKPIEDTDGIFFDYDGKVITPHKDLNVKYFLMYVIYNFDPIFINNDDDFRDDENDGYIALTKQYKLPFEPNTKYEDELQNALVSWYDGPTAKNINTLKKYYPAIKDMAKKWPTILGTGLKEKSPIYRGLEESDKLHMILKKTDVKDWKKTSDGIYVYTKPIKYSPRRGAQSWTTSVRTAKSFGSNSETMLITGASDEFVFNPDIQPIVSDNNYNEYEVIHIGQKFKYPVYIAITHKITFEELFYNQKRAKEFKTDISKVSTKLTKK